MSDAGVEEDVSRNKLEKELQGIEEAIDEMDQRVKDIEDRDMMAELESLSLEEEVQEVEELLNHMSKEELEKRLNMVEQIKEEYQEGKVHEKLEYLYRQIKELKEQQHDAQGAASNVEKLSERMEELEQRVQGSSSNGEKVATEMPEKYKKAVRSNYNELKKLKEELEEKSVAEPKDRSVDNSRIADLENRIEELENIKSRLQRMENNGEVVFVEGEDEEFQSPNETGDLSSIEFDLKSIKSRISQIEKGGTGSRVDKTNIQKLRKKVEKLENEVENKESTDIQAFKDSIERKVKEAERNAVSEEEVDKQIDELRNNIENQLRRLDSEIDRAVREGEDRLQRLEEIVQQKEDKDSNKVNSELSERIDTLMDIILDNQDYLEELAETEGIELENLKKEVEGLKNDVPKAESSGKSNVEEKLDNLAEHVMRNQEKLHQLEQKIDMENSPPHSEDVTIIS